MELFAVIVNGVHPVQCIVVWDVKANAQALSDHLNATISNNTQVQTVDAFWPDGMCEADKVWLTATDSYLRGDHLNTSGNPK